MDKVQIQWGDLPRTEAIEKDVWDKAEKILTFAPTATTLNVNLKIVNPSSSAGVATQSVSMELRLPNKQDIRTQKESNDLYKSIKEAQQAILIQLKSKKDQNLV
jgi:ribosome-associated translation inhibitor RaiA